MRHSDMINDIVETEKQAREITQAAIKEREQLDLRVQARVEELRAEYLKRADFKIHESSLNEDAIQQKALAEIDAKIEQSMQDINKKDSQNHDLWVSALVKRLTAL